MIQQTLADSQPSQYREQGYVVVDDLLTPADCRRLIDHARDVVEGRVQTRGEVWMEQEALDRGAVTDANRFETLFKIGHQMHHTPGPFREYATLPRLVEILTRLIGPDVKCIQSMFIDKPPGFGTGQPYHQDAWYLKTEPDTLMALWIALEDSDQENGCLAVIPGSHRDPILPVEEPEDPMQAKIFRITAVGAKERPEVEVPLKAGSGVFFTGHVLHRSGHNRSARHRRSYVLHYADARSKWLNDPKAKNPHLLVAGQEYPGRL
jgi:phytanoyl-CoA hydroxylase